MNFYLLNRDEALKIANEKETFYVSKTEVQGFPVEMYDYRLASYSDFIDNKAFEMRGLTFVYNFDTAEWERNLGLNKFFNVNQTIDYMYDDVKNKKIIAIADKLDGSMITFVKLPNNNVVAKSKMSFISDQAKMSQEIYNNNKNYQSFMEHMFVQQLTPIFELISPHNQVVLAYENTELNLLQIRDNNTGKYFSSKKLSEISKKFDIKRSLEYDIENYDLDILLELKETLKGIEGWVITFDDGQMAKIKTNHYLSLHGLIRDDVSRENLLIKTILDENIDDVLAELKPGSEKRIFIENIVDKLNHYFSHNVVEILKLRDEFSDVYKENKKEFSLKYSNSENFSIVMKTLRNGKEENSEKIVEKELKESILKRTNHLGDAKKFIEKITFNNSIEENKEIKSFRKRNSNNKEMEI